MRDTRGVSDFRMLAMVLVLGIAAFSLACRLADTAAPAEAFDDSMSVKLLGDSRLALSKAFYEEADTVFHKGVEHYRSKTVTNWFSKLDQVMAPTGHAHLQDARVTEIMPWLLFSIRMDPQNVTAYGVAAFWLAGEAGRPDLAEQVLVEARRANARDYRVYLESSRLALKQGHLNRAARFLDVAVTLWPGRQDPEERQTQLDRAEILMYKGLLYETDGDWSQATDLYRQILARFPGRISLQERLTFLETHGRSPSPPLKLWQSMLFQHAQVCDREKDEHEDSPGIHVPSR